MCDSGRQSFPPGLRKVLCHFLPASVIPGEKLTVTLFVPPTAKRSFSWPVSRYSLPFRFQKFDEAASLCGFSWVFPVWGSLTFLNVYAYVLPSSRRFQPLFFGGQGQPLGPHRDSAGGSCGCALSVFSPCPGWAISLARPLSSQVLSAPPFCQ